MHTGTAAGSALNRFPEELDKLAPLKVDLDEVDLSVLSFREAAPLWMAIRKRKNLRSRTHDSNQDYLNALGKFFGKMRLDQITAGDVRGYQLARAANAVPCIDGHGDKHPWKRKAGNSLINHEISVLGQMLRRSKLWAAIKVNYTPLPIAKWSPREVLSEEEEEHLFTVAAKHADVELAYWVATVTNNTTAAGCELRGLRLKHVFLRESHLDKDGVDCNPSEIYIPADAVKNDSRPRKIALNPTARWAIEQCYRRALRLGSCEPEHHLFPLRVGPGKYDPTRPASRWFLRNVWNRLRELAGLPHLCPHDLRHQCITRLLEREVQPETVRAIAGHVTEQMMQYYSHIRRKAKYAAAMTIEPARFAPGYRTARTATMPSRASRGTTAGRISLVSSG
jgi:integrase